MPTGAVVVQANWRDNPWFTAELEQERADCLRMQPDQYEHIWEGGYVTVSAGAYFKTAPPKRKLRGGIGVVALTRCCRCWHTQTLAARRSDRDAFTFWIVQSVGQQTESWNYYEAARSSGRQHMSTGCGAGLRAREHRPAA